MQLPTGSCVLKRLEIGSTFSMVFAQLPTGSCVLKQACDKNPLSAGQQLPTGSCVLKHLRFDDTNPTAEAATYG